MRSLKLLALGSLVLFLCPVLNSAEETRRANEVREAKVVGIWSGEYSYPQGSAQEPVKFRMILIQDGATVAGFIKEPNTFGQRNEPFLHAVFKGRVDAKEGKVTFTKTYDGTAGVDHSVEYSGDLSKDGSKVEGTWTIKAEGQADFSGGFTLKKEKLNKETLESLK